MTKNNTPDNSGLPTRDELREYIANSKTPLHKSDIAKAFGIKGQDKTKLRVLLRELSEEGGIEKNRRRTYQHKDALPERLLCEIVGIDIDGELIAKPADWQGGGKPPHIYVMERSKFEDHLQPGKTVLLRIKRNDLGEYEGKVLKSSSAGDEHIVGTFKAFKGGGYVYPTDRKIKEDLFIPPEYCDDLEDGDLVLAERLPAGQYPRSKNAARIKEKLGKKDDPRLISLISIHSHGIPTIFPKEALAEAEKMQEPDLSGGRVDMRDIPLVTIDGADARDFDDAVFAEPDTDPKNPDGWHLIVAIADVSYYVRSGSPLDRMAYDRGNSTYFADRVVPMLPERLSNDLCSLRPKVNRAALAVHLYIDKNARLIGHKFVRSLIRSAARLTYEQVEEAYLGKPDATTEPLLDAVIKPLYRAYASLKRARELRGALELDLPERKALIDETGNITAIVPRTRLASHQLIEEFMILANVAAAEALEAKNAPCVYRIHDRPADDRMETTREFLKEFGYSLPKSSDILPKNINHILKLSSERDDKQLIHTILLRTQSQAVYSPENIGHFGLALEKYAHFTSPIRRYADLLVHRALVKSYKLGDGALSDSEADHLNDISEHISATERRSMLAERDVMDRFTAQYLGHSIGKEFAGRVSSVTHFGLFVSLDESGADGIVPMSYLPRDYYIHDEKRHALVGKNSGRSFRLMDPVVVRVVEADSLRGSTVFEIITGDAYSPPRDRHKDNRQGKKPTKKYKDRREKSKSDRKRGKKKF